MRRIIFILFALVVAGASIAETPFDGAWCLTSPTGGAVWLKVQGKPDGVDGWMMWEIGGVHQLDDIRIEDQKLIIKEPFFKWYMTTRGMRRDRLGTDFLSATVKGDQISVDIDHIFEDGSRLPRETMVGVRSKPMPPAPDLTKLQFGDPIELFDGSSLDGWRLTNPGDNNAWSVRDGALFNNPHLGDGPDAKQFGNLRTDREFEDFRLQLEVRLPKGGNSGIYLRGRYEVQVTDSYGRNTLRGIGHIYSRVPALVNAAKPHGEWQQFDIILADRHVTVRLNNKLVIDNQPVEGCTGGALCSDDLKPGPIYFQGDHTSVEYRNIVLHPRVR